jgi:membrane protease YdiL (CAAX protease family)
VLALVYQYSRSVWPSVMVHALFNLPGIISILNAASC